MTQTGCVFVLFILFSLFPSRPMDSGGVKIVNLWDFQSTVIYEGFSPLDEIKRLCSPRKILRCQYFFWVSKRMDTVKADSRVDSQKFVARRNFKPSLPCVQGIPWVTRFTPEILCVRFKHRLQKDKYIL